MTSVRAGRPGRSAAHPTELLIDRIACDGFGMCAELLPELIRLDDWGYPIIAPGGIPADLLDHARRAADVCPVLALRLVHQPAARTVGGAPRAHGSVARTVRR